MKVKNMVNERETTYQKLYQNSKKKLTNGLLAGIVALALAIVASLFTNSILACIFSILSLFISGGEYISKLSKKSKKTKNDDLLLILIAVILLFFSANFAMSASAMAVYKLSNVLITYFSGQLGVKMKNMADALPEYANVVDEGGNVRYVPAKTISRGMKIMVKSGDVVPVDCIVSDGFSEFDTSNVYMSGANISLSAGDKVLAGYINAGSSVTCEAMCDFEESLTCDLTKLSSLSENSVSKVEKRFLKISKWYPLALILVAAIVVVATGFAGGVWAKAMRKAGVLLTVATTSSYVIGVPLISSCAIWNLKKKGLALASGDMISEFADINCVAFDNKGILTDNEYSIKEIYTAEGISEEDFLMIMGNCIGARPHPVSKIFTNYMNKYLSAENVMEFAGKGVECTIMGKTFICGSEGFVSECGIDVSEISGYTIYVSIDGTLLGAVKIEDSLKENVKETLLNLKTLGVEKIVMMTSERGEKAKEAFDVSGADVYFENLTANERAEKINSLKENEEDTVAYIGAQVEGEQAIETADVGITQINKYDNNLEYSKAVLLGDVNTFAEAIEISRLTAGKIEIHFYCASAIKIILAILGLFGAVNIVATLIIEALLTGVALLSSYDLLKK